VRVVAERVLERLQQAAREIVERVCFVLGAGDLAEHAVGADGQARAQVARGDDRGGLAAAVALDRDDGAVAVRERLQATVGVVGEGDADAARERVERLQVAAVAVEQVDRPAVLARQ
jgi:hypothetical protein